MVQEKGSVSLRIFLPAVCGMLLATLAMGQRLPASKTEPQQLLEEKEAAEEQAQAAAGETGAAANDLISLLPEDDSVRFSIREIEITGNTLVSREALLDRIPAVYNTAPGRPVDPTALFDFRPLQRLVEESVEAQPLSARTIQGLTQYLLAQYQKRGYAGIYVYVPTEAYGTGNALESGLLPIRIVEAKVSDIRTAYYDVNNRPAERIWLSEKALRDWSPVAEDRTANSRKLDEYINLLNLNPDRYVSATVSRSEEPNALTLTYNVYEANPWHFFVQIDNSGTEDVEWTPRFGLINTNLLGYDDKLTAIYQAVPDSTWNEEYAVFGSYDFPIFSPRLRLQLFAGYNEFDIGESPLANFLGRGYFAGGVLRYNLFQRNDWFFDVTGTLSYEESKISTFLTDFPEFGGIDTDTRMTVWGWGAELYRLDDMSDTFFAFNQVRSLNTSGEESFNAARFGADDDFDIYTFRARHSRYLDSDKIQRFTGAFTWIGADERLVPAKMTSFGGMYTVRGYDEYEIIADKGLLASVQYEYDLVRSGQIRMLETEEGQRPFLRKLAPLVFADYGQARIEDATGAEQTDQELASVGGGLIMELGANFTGTVYYGYPLIATEDTREGKGRLHVGLLLRW